MQIPRISKVNLDGTVRALKDATNFVGTEAMWEALTDEEKEQYDTGDTIDDIDYNENSFIVDGSTVYFPGSTPRDGGEL